jgi:hypothetical protein
MRTGFCAESAIPKPQIAEEKKSLMDGKKSGCPGQTETVLIGGACAKAYRWASRSSVAAIPCDG